MSAVFIVQIWEGGVHFSDNGSGREEIVTAVRPEVALGSEFARSGFTALLWWPARS